MLSRRNLLRGLIATPAVVAFSSLMPIKGVKFDPMIKLQSYPLTGTASGEWWVWWVHEGRLSRSYDVEAEMKKQFGTCYWEEVEEPSDGYYSNTARPNQCETAYESRMWVGGLPEERSHFGCTPPRERNEYGRVLGFRSDELQPVDTTAVHHIQDDHPQIPTEKLKAELNRICQWGA